MFWAIECWLLTRFIPKFVSVFVLIKTSRLQIDSVIYDHKCIFSFFFQNEIRCILQKHRKQRDKIVEIILIHFQTQINFLFYGGFSTMRYFCTFTNRALNTISGNISRTMDSELCTRPFKIPGLFPFETEVGRWPLHKTSCFRTGNDLLSRVQPWCDPLSSVQPTCNL